MSPYTNEDRVEFTASLPRSEYEKLKNGDLVSNNGLRPKDKGNFNPIQPEYSLRDERKEAMKDGMAELGMMFIESIVVDMLIPTVKAITVHKILPAIRKKKDEIVSRITQPAEAPAAEIKSTKIIDINNYRETA